MTSPGDIICLMMGAYFGIIAWAHFFNNKPSKPRYRNTDDTDTDTPWRDTPPVHRRERPI